MNISGVPLRSGKGHDDRLEDPAEAIRHAAVLVGAVANTREMAWWSRRSPAAALAAGMHAAALLGGDMGDVWAWSNGYGTGAIEDARTHPRLGGTVRQASPSFGTGPARPAGSIRLTMSKALTWLAIPDIRAMVTGPDAAPPSNSAFTDAAAPSTCSPRRGGDPVAPLFH